MENKIIGYLCNEIKLLKDSGYYKSERILTSPQGPFIQTQGKKVINLCSNNYLGFANDATVIQAAKNALCKYGFGLSSVRFICGTQDIHIELERDISDFLQMDDCILYSSCFDANAGVFEALFTSEDAIISDALNHASIIDGIRLSKAERYRYQNNNMEDLERQLKLAEKARFRVIVTDGVFSMDGIIADLPSITSLAEKYQALVMIDDSHAVGFMGVHGRGTAEKFGLLSKIDLITGTLGKALGGASGGYCAGRKELIEWLRQKSRPYLFSNSLAPVIVAASIEVLRLLKNSDHLREKLWENTSFFRKEVSRLGFQIVPGEHPIVPILLPNFSQNLSQKFSGDARLARDFSEELLNEGIYVIGFSYPVVPQGKARIRTQISAAHSQQDLESALASLALIGKRLGIIR